MEKYHSEIEPKPDINFRLLTREDFSLLQKWLEKPHVKEWWDEPTTLEAIEEKYGCRVDGESPTKCYLTIVEGTPIGMVQVYWVKDYPDYAKEVSLDNSVAIDWFIGEEAFVGRGLGPQIAASFISGVVYKEYGQAQYIVASPSVNNPRSIKSLEKAGFEKKQLMNVPGEKDPEQLLVKLL